MFGCKQKGLHLVIHDVIHNTFIIAGTLGGPPQIKVATARDHHQAKKDHTSIVYEALILSQSMTHSCHTHTMVQCLMSFNGLVPWL